MVRSRSGTCNTHLYSIGQCSSQYCYITNYPKTQCLEIIILLNLQILWVIYSDRVPQGQLLSVSQCLGLRLVRLDGWESIQGLFHQCLHTYVWLLVLVVRWNFSRDFQPEQLHVAFSCGLCSSQLKDARYLDFFYGASKDK